jgi:hypothetical protein
MAVAGLRAKFSLRLLLVLVAIVCLAIGSYVVGTKLANAERELRKLRNETGALTVSDRSKVHIISVDTGEPNTWRWRMFIPKGHKYSWHIADENIPKNDVPTRAGIGGFSNESYWERDNEVLVTAKLREGDNKNWTLSVDPRIGDSEAQMAGASLQIPDKKLQWRGTVPCVDGQVAGSLGVEMRDPRGAIILLQSRPCERQTDGSYKPSENPMPGFMIWLQEY